MRLLDRYICGSIRPLSPAPSPRKEGKGKTRFLSPSLFTGEGFGVGENRTQLGLDRRSPTASRIFPLLLFGFAVMLASGCTAQAATPTPTIAATLEPTSTTLPPTIARAASTLLPTLTPSATPKVAALAPTHAGSPAKPSSPVQATPTQVGPAQVAPTQHVAPTSTSALLALTSSVNITPIASQAALLS